MSCKMILRRYLHCTLDRMFKQSGLNHKGKSANANYWLKRQARDPFVKQARVDNWRCRSAYKLVEIDDKFKILRPGSVVIDCGGAPGSWSQVAVQRVNASSTGDNNQAKGRVIAVDLLHFAPIEGATILSECDFTEKDTQYKVIRLLDGRRADVVMSDMAPNATGVKSMDHELIMDLCRAALMFSTEVLNKGGTFVCKLWQGSEQKQFENILRNMFQTVNIVKPQSSRTDSSELFLLARNFTKK